MPKAASRLKMLEPTTLAILISLSPDNAELMLTDNSGALVPIATIVMPTITAGMPNLRAIKDALSTKKSAPFIRNIKPNNNNIILIIRTPPLLYIFYIKYY